MRLSILLATLAAGAALLPTSASAGILDQEQIISDTDAGLFNTQSAAQTFTAGITGGLDQADLLLTKSGNPPATVAVEIRETAAGIPTGTVIGSTGSIAAADVPVSPTTAFVPVTFTPPVAVTAGTQYALVAYAPGTGGNVVGWRRASGGNPYPNGQMFTSPDVPPGATWNGSGNADFAFKTYVTPPAATPSTPPPTASTSTGLRAAALKRCKKRAKKQDWSKERLKKCKKKARLLPL